MSQASLPIPTRGNVQDAVDQARFWLRTAIKEGSGYAFPLAVGGTVIAALLVAWVAGVLLDGLWAALVAAALAALFAPALFNSLLTSLLASMK
ncbi:MAG: hypothetical protein H6747_08980 [Deltaproteobacteria bacterium]|nr:hypothetical protein [Deltaproteobacteria bacterium]